MRTGGTHKPLAREIVDMGDPACYRDFCPECDRQVTIVDEECPECGARIPEQP